MTCAFFYHYILGFSNVKGIMLCTLQKSVAPFQTVWMDTGSLPRYQTQTYQLLSTLNPTRLISKNAGLSVSYINYQTPPQTTPTEKMKLHTNSSSNPDTALVSTSVNPPNSTLVPATFENFDSVSSILLLRKATVIWPKDYIFVLLHLYMS